MIREDHKLPRDVTNRIPLLIKQISNDREIIALFSFGSITRGDLKPLSDLDFGVIVSNILDRKTRFDKHLDLIGLFNKIMKTDEVDLILMNDAPLLFCHNILKTGKLLYYADSEVLTGFIEKTIKGYLDFRYFRDEFDREFIKGIGFHG
jgi:predicted nucleotidyltransferase